MRLLPLLALLPATLWAADLPDTSAQRAAAAQLLGKLSTELKQEMTKTVSFAKTRSPDFL